MGKRFPSLKQFILYQIWVLCPLGAASPAATQMSVPLPMAAPLLPTPVLEPAVGVPFPPFWFRFPHLKNGSDSKDVLTVLSRQLHRERLAAV